VIASDLAEELFPGGNAVGRRLYRLRGDKRAGEVEIVGVVDADLVGRSDNQQRKRIFVPDAIDVERSLLIRTEGPGEPLIPALRATIQSEARMLPIRSMLTMAQIDRNQRSVMVQAAGAAAGAGLLVMLLASIGLYAVVALGVSQRRREIGIRIAIGGRPRKVALIYFGRGVRLGIIGLIIGLPIGIAGLRFLAMEVGMPRANFPLIALAVGGVVVGVACLASWLPARQAARVDPVVALRAQ
jgi:putative ABC transport system permease protein